MSSGLLCVDLSVLPYCAGTYENESDVLSGIIFVLQRPRSILSHLRDWCICGFG